MNVVRPARASVTRSVPRSPNLKYVAIPSTPADDAGAHPINTIIHASASLGGSIQGIIDGLNQIVAVDPNNPDNLPALSLLDLHAEKAFKLGGVKQLKLVVDGFNIFNTNTATDMSVNSEGYGRITNIPQGRRFRMGVRFQF